MCYEKILSWRTLEISAFIIAIFSIFLTFSWTEPAKLEVSHELNLDNPNNQRLLIHVNNTAIFRETGNISIYRIEVDPHKPHMVEYSLKPRENFTFDLWIDFSEVQYSVPVEKHPNFPFLASCEFPTSKLYFIHEPESISYKLTCDNCNSEVIKRIPNFQKTITSFEINTIDNTCDGFFPLYSWIQFNLEDLNLT